MPYQQLEGYVPEEEIKEELTEEEESNPNITHGTRLWSILSILFSAIGVILIFIPIVGIFFALAGIGLSVLSRKKNGYFYNAAVLGIIIGAIAVASCGFFLIYNAMTEAGVIPNLFKELIK